MINRVQELEKSLNGMVALFRQSGPLPVAPSTRISPLISQAGLTAVPEPRAGVLEMGLIGLEQAELLLENFRSMARHFPYILIPEAITVSELSRRQPMLLHAILVTSSWRERSLQRALEQAYTREICSRMIVEGEKSLDMLQSLLVYVTW